MPQWKVLEIFNRFGVGDFVKVETKSTPCMDLPKFRRRSATTDAPLIAAYACKSKNGFAVFVISRKVDGYPIKGDDGYTPVTLNLPFKTAKKVTLYKMDNNLRDHNLDADVVKIKTQEISVKRDISKFIINDKTGATARGVAPGSVYCYVFDL